MRQSLRDLVSILPYLPQSYKIDSGHAIESNLEMPTGYVWPDVESVGGGIDDRKSGSGNVSLINPVLLISAPGAMGKSVAARAIASDRNAIYMDLAGLQVGSSTLVGELVASLGFQRADSFTDEIREGRAIIVLDSTDEAQLRSGNENFIAFLSDLKKYVNNDLNAVQIVILGRSDSIDITSMGLEYEEIKSSRVEIAPFTYEQALEFINMTLDGDENFDGHRKHPVPFEELVKSVFLDIMDALTRSTESSRTSVDATVDRDIESLWSENEKFLGYAPVLLALAKRLRVDNIKDEKNKVESSRSNESRATRERLLGSIVESILDREAGKVQDTVGQRFDGRGITDEALALLYGNDEQAVRLLAYIGVSDIDTDFPRVLPDHLRSDYERLINDFLKDHPFIRTKTDGSPSFVSPVFSDYLRAWVISSPISGAISGNRAKFLSTLPAVGPFFARFLAELVPSGEFPTVPEDLVDDAISSHLAGSSSARAAYYSSSNQGAEDDVHYLGLFNESEGKADASSLTLTFKVTELSGVLTLRGGVARTSIITDESVLLSSGHSGEFQIGPDSVIVAQEIEILANKIAVAPSEGARTSLISAGAVSHSPELRVSFIDRHHLAVSWPDPWYQWTELYLDLSSMQNQKTLRGPEAAQVVVATRKILLAFRSSTRESPAVSAEKVDQLLVRGNAVARAVREGMIELEIIRREGSQYFLETDMLGEFGISWADLTTGDPLENLSGIGGKIINTNYFKSFWGGSRGNSSS